MTGRAAFGVLVATRFGPAGIAAGSVIGALGGQSVNAGNEPAEFDPRLQKASEPNTPALILWTEPKDIDAFAFIFRRFLDY